jgi:glycosyltransferase involved in cell wall biosynthesis
MHIAMSSLPCIGFILPCYNEQEVLRETAAAMSAYVRLLIHKEIISPNSFIVFVNDGSADNTFSIIAQLTAEDTIFKGLNLAANVGHQRALYAGLVIFRDRADALISLDADLQDDITVTEEMIRAFRAGSDIVYGIRKERKSDTYFKRKSAELFYKLMLAMKVKIYYNHADYRLASRRVLDQLAQFREYHLFLRGIFPLMGYNHSMVYYDRKERTAGQSKYPFRKMLSFAWEGITSFSSYPLRLVSTVGFIVFLTSILLSIYTLVLYFFGYTIHGWVSTVLPIYFLGGIQLLCVSVLGEYIGKIYIELKDRPRYGVERILEKGSTHANLSPSSELPVATQAHSEKTAEE